MNWTVAAENYSKEEIVQERILLTESGKLIKNSASQIIEPHCE